MRKTLNMSVTAGLFLLLSLPGCQQQEPASSGSGTIEANQAYISNFGPPPETKQGQGFARVAYLPLQKSPEKLQAIPLFLFTGQRQLQHILDRLTGGELIQTAVNRFYNPFPEDIEVAVRPAENGTLTISLQTHRPWSEINMLAAGHALAETALQYNDIKTVRILLNNKPFPHMPASGYLHDPEILAETLPPKPVLIMGMWEKPATAPEEILVEFDRPIKVNHFRLYDKAGNPVAGKYFTSMFQMAVVVHPKNPEEYHEGTILSVKWDVVDALGLSNHGTNTFALQRYER